MPDITACGLCGSGDLKVILDMGDQPLAERFDDPRTYPLKLAECGRCTLVQLTHIVDQRDLFPPAHPYATGNTQFLRDHFAALAAELGEGLRPGDLVVDIGCNDGTLLAAFRDDVRRVGVEPTDQGEKCAARGIHTWINFFTADLARGILDMYGPAKVITAW